MRVVFALELDRLHLLMQVQQEQETLDREDVLLVAEQSDRAPSVFDEVGLLPPRK